MKANESAYARAHKAKKSLVTCAGREGPFRWFAYQPHGRGIDGGFGSTPLEAITEHYRNLDAAKQKQA